MELVVKKISESDRLSKYHVKGIESRILSIDKTKLLKSIGKIDHEILRDSEYYMGANMNTVMENGKMIWELFDLNIPSINGNESLTIKTNDFSIPWNLLFDDDFLFYKYKIGLKPLMKISEGYTSFEYQKTKSEGIKSRKILLIGNPTKDIGKWNLPGSENEVKKIAKKIGNSELHHGPRNRKFLIDKLSSPRYGVLHYSGHTAVDDKGGYFILSNNGVIEKLYGREISNMDIGNKLVILNSCKSTVHDMEKEGELTPANGAIATAIQSSHVSGIIGASWTTYDTISAKFMINFWKLLKNNSIGDALLKSRIRFRDEVENNQYGKLNCLAFALYGDPEIKIF